MATLTIADLDNGKRDLQTVDEVANSRAATAATRFGQQTTTLYEAIRRINAAGELAIEEIRQLAESVILGLGFAPPVPYAPGINVTESNFTVIGPDGVVYAAQPSQIPFTTGVWDQSQWYPIQNTFTNHQLLVFRTKTEADIAATVLPDGQPIYVTGLGEYEVQAGALVLVRAEAKAPFKKNLLWPGALKYWPMGHTRAVLTTQRLQIPCGVTHARIGLMGGTNILHAGDGEIQIQRVAGNASTAAHTMAFTLAQVETAPLSGQTIQVHFEYEAGATYSGGAPVVRVQCSREPEQPILQADGRYTNGHITVAEWTGTGGTAVLPECVQASLVVTIPFSGVAGADDFIRAKNIGYTIGDDVGRLEPIDFAEAETFGRTRYQTTYPYGAPRGSLTEQGSLTAIVQNTAVNWAVSVNWQFSPTMAQPPKVIFQSPNSNTESRWLNKTTNAAVNGLAFNVSENSVTLTNNAVLAVNDRLLCQATAEVML